MARDKYDACTFSAASLGNGGALRQHHDEGDRLGWSCVVTLLPGMHDRVDEHIWGAHNAMGGAGDEHSLAAEQLFTHLRACCVHIRWQRGLSARATTL